MVYEHSDKKVEEHSDKKVEWTAKEILEKEYPEIYKGYSEVIEEQFELFAKKHLDYGMTNITAGTQLSTPEEIQFSITGIWYRLSDKVSRWKNLITNSKIVHNEKLVDTYQDIANYAIIAQLVSTGKWKK